MRLINNRPIVKLIAKKNSIAKLCLESFEINLTVKIFACGELFNGELELQKFLSTVFLEKGPNLQPIRREKTLLSYF